MLDLLSLKLLCYFLDIPMWKAKNYKSGRGNIEERHMVKINKLNKYIERIAK